MKEIYKTALWVGCVLCVAPIAVQGYMMGKAADALASGSKAKFTLNSYQTYDYIALCLGASIIIFVIARTLFMTLSTGSNSELSEPLETI